MNNLKKKIGVALVAFALCFQLMIPQTVYAADTSYKTWKQTDSRWGSMRLGSSSYTMSSSGCLVTAVSMLICHSGSASASSFNPGTLCTYLSNHGGFDANGGLYWAKVSGAVNGFSLENWKVSMAGMSKSQKIDTMADWIEDGYAVVVSVRNGGHWVALDRIVGDKVYVMDPSSSSTDLFSMYGESGIDRLAIYKGVSSAGTVDRTGSGDEGSDSTPLNGTGKVNCSSLNVRSDAGTGSSIVTTISKGTGVTIIAEKNDSSGNKWYKVTVSGSGKVGYVLGQYITVSSSGGSAPDDTTVSKTGTVNCSSLNVRSGAGTGNSLVTTITRGTALTISAEAKDSSGNVWYKASFTSGGRSYSGYVHSSYVTVKDTGDNGGSDDNDDNDAPDTPSKTGVVNCSSLYLRSGAGTGNSIVKALSKGTSVTITGEASDGSGAKWYKVTAGSSNGYVHSSYITVNGTTDDGSDDDNDDDNSDTPVNASKGTVNYSSVYVRSGAGTDKSVVTVAYKGNSVAISGTAKDSSGNTWYKVTVNGSTGYIRSDLLTISSGSDNLAPDDSTGTTTGTVSGGWLNVRSGAGTSNRVLVVIPEGTKVSVLETAKDSSGSSWYKVSLTYGSRDYTGYASAQYIK